MHLRSTPQKWKYPEHILLLLFSDLHMPPATPVPSRSPHWCLRIKMTCICFHQDLIGVAFFSADCQTVIFNKLMWFIHPCRTVISECLSVDKYGGFSSGIQVHHDSLSFCCFRKDHSAFKPTVFPGFPPYKAWFCRRKVPL